MDAAEDFQGRVNRGEPRESALMITELVGYTRLADREAERALKILDEHNAIVKESINRHKGVVARVLGDAHLVEFADAVSAARCALDVQFRVSTRNARVQDFQRMASRIGLHFGRVTPQGGDLGGDALKLLGLLTGKAPVRGGICVSQTFQDLVKNKRGFEIEDLGDLVFEGIPQKQHAYLISVAGAPKATAAPPPERGFMERSLLLKSVPSLAPLPLDLPPSDYAPEIERSLVRPGERSLVPFIAASAAIFLAAVGIYFLLIRGTSTPQPVPPVPAQTTANPVRPTPAATAQRPTLHAIPAPEPHVATPAKKPLSNLERLKSALARIERLPKAQQKKILPDLKDWKKVERDMEQGKKGADVDKKVLAQLEKKLDEVEKSNHR